MGYPSCSSAELKKIDRFCDYVLELFANAEKYNIFITSSDAHVPPKCKNRKLDLLKSLGIKTDLQKTFRHSFLAVIDRGEVKIELSSENKKLEAEYGFGEHSVKMISQGYNAAPVTNSSVSINIDGFECAVNKRGLNIVVWDCIKDYAVDSVCFDTFLDDAATRKAIDYDLEALCSTYKLICELSAISSDFANHYSKILSRDKLNADKINQYLLENGLFLAKTEELKNKGISVFAFEQTNVSQLTNPTEWEKLCIINRADGFLKQDIDKYFEISGLSKIYSREVFDDILKNPVRTEKVKDYYYTVAQKSKYVNVDSFGQRPTESFPEKPYNTLHIFGDSIACTWEMADCHTLTNQLQELVKSGYRVVNHSVAGRGFDNAGSNMLDIEFKQGDVIILLYQMGRYTPVKNDLEHMGIPIINLFPYFNAPHSEEIFFDRHHPNPNGYKIIAKVISDTISAYIDVETQPLVRELFAPHSIQKTLPLQEELTAWIKEISMLRPKIGGIVMNCNPFTLGHRYLIEQSAAKVDKLFIFVVEEDKSIFPFADRIELVRRGTADLKNVTVLPSGKFIISSLTFTAYFEKSEHQDRVIDPGMDVELFGAYIAPALGITVRFAGEEPLDNITRQYNETMAKILPRYGVEFEEIPRKEQAGEVISASRVRKLLKANDFNEIAKIVPESTLDYLKERYI